MLRLSKKVEYGLMALRHLALLPEGCSATAREIAERSTIPYELCAKSLSQLSRAGLITSTQGVRGGYALGRGPAEITLHQVVMAIEGEEPAIAECLGGDGNPSCSCGLHESCSIRDPLKIVQEKIATAFSTMTLAEMI